MSAPGPVTPPPPAAYRPENVGDNRRTQRAAERRDRRHEKANQKRSKKKAVLLILLAVTLLVGAGIGTKEAIEHNAYRRSVETSELLDAIETSEEIMISWQDAVESALGDPVTAPETVARISEEHLEELNAARKAFTSEGGLEIASWHDDIRAARDRYLAHRDAWESYLKAAARDWTEIDDMQALDRINRSFDKACASLVEIEQETERYPNRSRNNSSRIEYICKDTGGTPV